ncbi:gliding motility-associated C-terminal domain-containing protein [Brumimicrobium salinarum]|nr:gliding motility-associated C-terminal domain-containing protein [Brumimicrobium salinarum]
MKILNNMRVLLFIVILTFVHKLSIAQDITLVNSELTVQSGAVITIQGGVKAESNGRIDNSGEIQIRNDIENNSGGVLFTNQNAGEVLLYGNNQEILGIDSTVFYNLYFSGNTLDEKSFLTSASILNELDINNQILETNVNKVYLLNPSLNSLFVDQGFISSNTLGGYFVRATNSSNEYLFPTGATNLSPNHRVVLITPDDNSTNLFQVRLSNIGSSMDNSGTSASGATGPFDINLKTNDLGEINNAYYHNIHQLSGNSSAEIKLFWNVTDGNFKTIAQWRGTQFYDALADLELDNYFNLDRALSIKNYTQIQDDVFALADVNIEINIPNGVSANNDGINDLFYIESLEYYPNNSLTIFNRWGDEVFSAQPYENDWSGQSNVQGAIGGDDLPAGTYYYLFKPDDESEVLKGFIEFKKK